MINLTAIEAAARDDEEPQMLLMSATVLKMVAVIREASKALRLLDMGHELASAAAADYHESMRGYRPWRHKQMDDDVANIAKGAAALREALKEFQP